MLVPEKKKQLTEKQESFLENLFGQARGNPRELLNLQDTMRIISEGC